MKKPALVLLVFLAATATALGLASCGDSSKKGGTLTGTYAAFPEYLDPALAYSQEAWTAMYNTYLPLLTYRHASGVEGSEVVPALAEGLPEITNGGKTYALTLHDGLEYSDGTPVKASDFKRSIERVFKLNSPGAAFYENIVGAEEFAKTKRGGISGIKTDNGTGEITIDLVQPRSTFVNELGMLFAAVLPGDTPARNLTSDPPPATGPYMITEVEPGRSWSYARNPAWERSNGALIADVPDGNFDRIQLTVVRNDSTQVNEIEQDKVQWMQTPPPSDRYAEIRDKYEGTQFRVEHPINLYFFWMNTSQPPFDDLEVRKAVNHAIDTRALERIYAGSLVAAHQILPEGMPGHEPFNLYPHDMAKAKRMIAAADPADREITVWTNNEDVNKDAGVYYNGVLEELGFETTLKVLNGPAFFPAISNQKTPNVDTGFLNWYQDYPNPNNFFQPLLSGESIAPVFNTNLARIDDPKLNAKIAKLGEEELGPEQEAEYAALDRSYMELAPWAPYGTNTVPTFVNSEIDLDAVIFNPTFGHDLTSFRLR